MTALPPAIIFLNPEVSEGIISSLQEQLRINQTWTGQEFNDIINSFPTYPDQIHLNGLRVLVLQSTYQDYTNRTLADVVLFVKNGLVNVEKNNYGPPKTSYPLDRINIYDLLRANNSSFVNILSNNNCSCRPHHCCCYPFGYRGIIGIEMQANDQSGVHCPNPDAWFNNEEFLNR